MAEVEYKTIIPATYTIYFKLSQFIVFLIFFRAWNKFIYNCVVKSRYYFQYVLKVSFLLSILKRIGMILGY